MAVIFDKKHSCFFLYQIYLRVSRTFFKNLKNKPNIYYLPIFIDLKTGVYGKNLSFTASKHVVSMLNKALADVLADYLEHTDEDSRLTTYPIYEDT